MPRKQAIFVTSRQYSTTWLLKTDLQHMKQTVAFMAHKYLYFKQMLLLQEPRLQTEQGLVQKADSKVFGPSSALN